MAANTKTEVYQALVADLAHSIVPTTIMGITLAVIGFFAAMTLGSVTASVAATVGTAASLAKVVLILVHHRRNRHGPVDRRESAIWESCHAVATIPVAMSVAMLGTTTFRHADQTMQMLGTALVFGYCSGVVSRLSIRPVIASTALTLTVVPTAVAAILVPDVPHRIVAAMFAIFLVGGYESVRFTHRSAVRQIRLRLEMATLARCDPLTGLVNRLGLRETFHAMTATPHGTIVVHCLDLDGFKPVNDRHGHATGDILLREIAGRLRSTVPEGAVVARTGGDEFVVVQRCAADLGDAGCLAEVVERALSVPYVLAGHEVRVGASIGHASAPAASADLDAMLGLADSACYRAKRRKRLAQVPIAPAPPSSAAIGELVRH